MRAYVYDRVLGRAALTDVAAPVAVDGQLVIAVEACGLCGTDLHILDGDRVPVRPQVVLGHQVVGRVVEVGRGAGDNWRGVRVGVPWLVGTCGHCQFCATGRENLCAEARFTGFDRDGGLAERMVVPPAACLRVPTALAPDAAAPLLCAGLIGWRALRMAGIGERIGVYGFGAAGRLVAQILRWQGRRLFAFTRPGDEAHQAHARSLGAAWAGGSDQKPPEPLDAAILFAGAGELVPQALAAVAPGGTVVCGETDMTDIPTFRYDLLWREKVVRSVANLTHRDGVELLAIAAAVPLRVDVTAYPLTRVDDAIADLRAGRGHGAAVVTVNAQVQGAR
jgi:propanol-preferring alcohol dehydrogenase